MSALRQIAATLNQPVEPLIEKAVVTLASNTFEGFRVTLSTIIDGSINLCRETIGGIFKSKEPVAEEGQSAEASEATILDATSPDEPHVIKLRQIAILNPKEQVEVLSSLAGLAFQVDNKGEFFTPSLSEHRGSQEGPLKDLTIRFRAEFVDKARSLYALSVEIFAFPTSHQRFEIADLPLILERLSSSERPEIEPRANISGQLRFSGLETNEVYRFITYSEGQVPFESHFGPRNGDSQLRASAV